MLGKTRKRSKRLRWWIYLLETFMIHLEEQGVRGVEWKGACVEGELEKSGE